MSITKFNHSNPFNYTNTKDAPFFKLHELAENAKDPEKVYKIRAVYVNTKSRYGDSPVAVCEGFNVNLPEHMLRDIRSILQDEEVIAEINAQKAGFKIRKYENSRGGTSYTVEWVSLEEDLPF